MRGSRTPVHRQRAVDISRSHHPGWNSAGEHGLSGWLHLKDRGVSRLVVVPTQEAGSRLGRNACIQIQIADPFLSHPDARQHFWGPFVLALVTHAHWVPWTLGVSAFKTDRDVCS